MPEKAKVALWFIALLLFALPCLALRLRLPAPILMGPFMSGSSISIPLLERGAERSQTVTSWPNQIGERRAANMRSGSIPLGVLSRKRRCATRSAVQARQATPSSGGHRLAMKP
jgi:hypothetical protein